MGEYASKRFVIYEYTDGAAEDAGRLQFCGGLGMMDKATERYWIEGRFYLSTEENPAVVCEMKVLPELVANYTNREISSQVQRILHYGIAYSGNIILSDRMKFRGVSVEDTGTRDFEYYRHGNDITRWVSSLTTL